MLSISSLPLHAQEVKSYQFQGFFNGANLNVQCRAAVNKPWLACECFDSIAVNGTVIDSILYEGFQIDMANKTNLAIHDTVVVDIFFQSGCDFRLLNPNDFLPKEILAVGDFRLSDDNVLHWSVQQNYPQLHLWVQIEQYKWNEWVKIGPNINITEDVDYHFDITPFLHKGENIFRATVASINQDRVPSNSIEVKHKKKKVKCKFKKKEKYVYFSQNTHYELYNSEWKIAQRGIGDSLNLTQLPNGIYHLRYGSNVKKLHIKPKK